jgi:hypothetical protein
MAGQEARPPIPGFGVHLMAKYDPKPDLKTGLAEEGIEAGALPIHFYMTSKVVFNAQC